MIEGGSALILRNNIYENNDGIVSLTSVPTIWKNKITKNKSNGYKLDFIKLIILRHYDFKGFKTINFG